MRQNIFQRMMYATTVRMSRICIYFSLRNITEMRSHNKMSRIPGARRVFSNYGKSSRFELMRMKQKNKKRLNGHTCNLIRDV